MHLSLGLLGRQLMLNTSGSNHHYHLLVRHRRPRLRQVVVTGPVHQVSNASAPLDKRVRPREEEPYIKGCSRLITKQRRNRTTRNTTGIAITKAGANGAQAGVAIPDQIGMVTGRRILRRGMEAAALQTQMDLLEEVPQLAVNHLVDRHRVDRTRLPRRVEILAAAAAAAEADRQTLTM